MAYTFGDGFDLYAAVSDLLVGYWDGGATTSHNLITGRFTGSQAFSYNTASAVSGIYKNGANDTVHHIVFAYRQNQVTAATTSTTGFSLSDGATAQCTFAFRLDGAVVLTSGGIGGTVLATWTGALPAANTWTAYEFEVVINSTTGSITARRNGNTSNDWNVTGLNTRGGTTNNYANRLQIIHASGATAARDIDDILWRSDASSVSWVGDVRCYTRMPTSDVSVQFSRSPASNTQTPFTTTTSTGVTNGTARYTPFTAAYDGTIGTATISMNTGYTGNMKCSIFASSGSAPTTVLGSANILVNPATGTNTLTFGTPVSVSKGTQYWIGFDSDTSSGAYNVGSNGGVSSTTAYASFPVASPTPTPVGNQPICSLTITVGTNNSVVNELQQDGATSYVYSSNSTDADFYSIAPLSGTPASVIAVITRGFVQKSDAGTRNGAVQLKSGSTTVQSTSTALSTSWGWLYRVDTTDPATGSAWTPTAVNSAQIGPVVTA